MILYDTTKRPKTIGLGLGEILEVSSRDEEEGSVNFESRILENLLIRHLCCSVLAQSQVSSVEPKSLISHTSASSGVFPR